MQDEGFIAGECTERNKKLQGTVRHTDPQNYKLNWAK
jgi:hypothetical protein